MRRLTILGALTCSLLIAAPAAAAPCDDLDGWECGSIDVPIDRSNPGLGKTTVGYAVRLHDDQSKPAAGTTMVTDAPGKPTADASAGGFFEFTAIPGLTDTHDLVLVDVRGTGRRQPLDCPDLQHGAGAFSASVPACATQLGAARDFYTYGDMADDMDAVRADLGLGEVDVYGTGHATPVAHAYAIRHAAHLRSLILDSTADFPEWPDEDLDNGVRVTGLLCRRSPLCSREIRDPEGEVAWLAQRLRRQPLSGTGYDADGEPRRVRLTEAHLAYLLLFDKSGPQRTHAELPAAARALRDGDPVPLLRLAAENDFPLPVTPFDAGDPAEDSTASYVASYCPEWPLGWDNAAPRAQRLAQFNAARAKLPRDYFAPFSLEAGLTPLPDPQCLDWPAPARTNPIAAPGTRYPDVPMLAIHGDLNTDHPIVQSKRIAARFPNGRFVRVVAGQSASGWSECARRIIRTFVTTLDPGDTRCEAAETPVFPGVGSFPRHVRGNRKVVAVAVQTYLDVLYTQLFRAQGNEARGLRGGSYTAEFGDTGLTLTLDRVRFADDVHVSGSGFFSFDPGTPNLGELKVGGRHTKPGVIRLGDEPIFDNTVDKLSVHARIGERRLRLRVPIH